MANILPASPATRLAAFYSLAFTVVTLALGAAIYLAIREELRSELLDRVETERAALWADVKAGRTIADVVADRSTHESGEMRYALLDLTGHVVAGRPVAAKPARGWSNMYFLRADGSLDATRAYATTTSAGQTLVVGADPEAIEELDERIGPILAVAFGLIVVIGVSGAFFLGSALRRRLELVDETARAIIAGNFSSRVPLAGTGDEFDRLATTLNRMFERIEGLLENLRQVSSDVAHDLRTPLTRLRHNLELAAAGPSDPDALKLQMRGAIDQTEDMLRLFGAILAVSEVEAEGAALRMSSVDMSLLVTELAESYRLAAEDSGHWLDAEIEPDIIVFGNRELLAQLIVNLLDNVLRHTPAGTRAWLAVRSTQTRVTLAVCDNGPGIPGTEHERVLKRFTRLERSRSTPGHGLGLSLVAAIAHAHGGSVSFYERNPGVEVSVTIDWTPR